MTGVQTCALRSLELEEKLEDADHQKELLQRKVTQLTAELQDVMLNVTLDEVSSSRFN